jgi:hypothetical protein
MDGHSRGGPVALLTKVSMGMKAARARSGLCRQPSAVCFCLLGPTIRERRMALLLGRVLHPLVERREEEEEGPVVGLQDAGEEWHRC